MVSFTKLCSLGKSGCEKFKESCFLPSLNSSSQVEPIPNRSTGSSPARLGEASMSEGRSVHRMLTPDFFGELVQRKSERKEPGRRHKGKHHGLLTKGG